jgi:hypothetical protein
MVRPRTAGMTHVGAGIWRVHKADGSPMRGGATALSAVVSGRFHDAGPRAYSGQPELSTMST